MVSTEFPSNFLMQFDPFSPGLTIYTSQTVQGRVRDAASASRIILPVCVPSNWSKPWLSLWVSLSL